MNFIEYLDANYTTEHVSGKSQIKVNGECPFCHEDRSDLRLYVNAETGAGQCFHCGKGFNSLMFVAAAEHVSYSKAIKILNDDEDVYIKESGCQIAEKAPVAFPNVISLFDSPDCFDYLVKRKISIRTARHFKLSYCQENVMLDGRVFYTAGRLIIPITDMTGKVVSWQGRDITGKSKTRYLFPPNFKQSEYLYNCDTISLNPDYLIMSEGVFDVFGWYGAGFKNTIGTFGKKISDAQVEIIRTIKPAVLFMAWDSDAADKKYEFCEKYGHIFSDIRIVDLVDQDADEMTKAALTAALSSASCYEWDEKILAFL